MDKNYQYYDQELLELTTVLLDRDESKEFFSIFEYIQPKLEQMWMHLSDDMQRFNSFDDGSIEKIFYEGSREERQTERRRLINDLIGEEKPRYTTRRVSVLFGYDSRQLPYFMKLVYIKNARGHGCG